jgi:hypothetical protein
MTGGWAVYSWPPAIVLVSVMVVFLLDLASERYVETKYGQQNDENVEDLITTSRRSITHRHPDAGDFPPVLLQNDDLEAGARAEVEAEQKGHQDMTPTTSKSHAAFSDDMDKIKDPIVLEKLEAAQNQAYKQQIAAFLVLEFGVIFHSVCLGLKTYTNCRCLCFDTGRHRSEPRCRWQGVFNTLSSACLSSILRGSRYRRPNVRYPLSYEELAALVLVRCIRSDNSHRHRHRSRCPHDIQPKLRYCQYRFWCFGFHQCWYLDLHGIGGASCQRLFV